jgi:hypothetical protein
MFAYRTLWFPSFPFGFAQHRPVWLELRNIQELQGGAKKISPPGLVFQTCRHLASGQDGKYKWVFS